MKTFLYKSKDSQSHKELGRKLNDLPEGEYIIEVKKNRPVRSLQANKFFWAVIRIYAIHTGHLEQEINVMFRMDRHSKIIVNSKGEEKRVPLETKTLDTKEMGAVINNLLQWGRENFPEVIIPRQEDATYIQLMNIQNEYSKTFSGY